jgi:hypothetical protein
MMKKRMKVFGCEWERIWMMDDCAPDAETLGCAWLRYFGQPLPPHTERVDEGDCFVDRYDHAVAVHGPVETSIWIRTQTFE